MEDSAVEEDRARLHREEEGRDSLLFRMESREDRDRKDTKERLLQGEA